MTKQFRLPQRLSQSAQSQIMFAPDNIHILRIMETLTECDLALCDRCTIWYTHSEMSTENWVVSLCLECGAEVKAGAM